MANVHAQHATCGKYHLETRFVVDHWEWSAVVINKAVDGKLPEYTGTGDSLEGAKKSAMASIGLSLAPWTDIGPRV